MDDEISEKAKKAIVDNARRKAFDRLERDDAHSRAAMQRRVRAIAQERNIPPADFHRVMYKRPSTLGVLQKAQGKLRLVACRRPQRAEAHDAEARAPSGTRA
jgi:hypothetical protein